MANETPPLHLFAETTKFTTWPVTPRYLRQDAPSSCPAVRGLRCQGMLLVRQATTHKGAPEFSTLALDDEAMRAHNVADGTARVGSRAAPRLGFGGLLHLMAGSPLPLLRGHVPPERLREQGQRRRKLDYLDQQFHGQSPPLQEAPPGHGTYVPPTVLRTIA